TSGIVLAPTLLHASDGVPLKATIVTTSESFQPGTFPVLGFVTSTGEGTSTHLGKLTTSGQVALIWTSEGVWFVGAGTSVAANGDELYNTLEGLDTGYGDTSGTFTITGGTGRFAGATGSGTFTSSRDADDVMTAVHEGTIDYKKN
ncbi:MAG: hypothetical protein ABFS86_19590, partial [Planctomycetota bacterium]